MDYRYENTWNQAILARSAWNVSGWPGWPLGRFLGAGYALEGGWLGERVSGRV